MRRTHARRFRSRALCPSRRGGRNPPRRPPRERRTLLRFFYKFDGEKMVKLAAGYKFALQVPGNHVLSPSEAEPPPRCGLGLSGFKPLMKRNSRMPSQRSHESQRLSHAEPRTSFKIFPRWLSPLLWWCIIYKFYM